MDRSANFPHKNRGGGVMVAENIRNIFIVGKILTGSKSRGIHM